MCAHRPLSTVEVRKQNRNRVYRHLITLGSLSPSRSWRFACP